MRGHPIVRWGRLVMQRVGVLTLLCLVMASANSARAQNLPAADAHVLTRALAAVDACLSRLDPQSDIGYDRIAARCPDLARQLEQSPLGAWLPRSWKEPGNDLSAGSLRELRTLAQREQGMRSNALAPDVERLRSVLADLDPGAREHRGWWVRFKTWLRSVLDTGEDSVGEGWFARMISHVGISQSVIEIVSYIALALVVVLAGVIVFNELRVGRVPARLRERDGRKGPRSQVRTGGEGWDEVERVSRAERPRKLLELIVAKLVDLRRLPPAGALTVRELTRAAQLAQPEDRNRLAAVALAAEQARFSQHEMSPQELEAPLAQGRELLEQLSAVT